MAGYIGSGASVVSSGAENKKVFDITTNTTSLTGLNYTVGKVHVYHNGVRLVDGTDFTATNSTSITLTVAAVSGDQVVVVSYASFQLSEHYTSAEADAEFVNDPNGAITVDGSNVGIGTSSPTSIIHSLHPTSPKLTLERDSTSLANNNVIGEIAMAHKDSNDAGTAVRIIGRAEGTGGGAGLAFNTGLPSSTTERMRIDSSGNVGIGTTNLHAKLTINSSSALEQRVIHDANGTTVIRRDGTTSYILSESGATTHRELVLGSQTSAGGTIQERMRIDSSGNVLVGTTTTNPQSSSSNSGTQIGDGFVFAGRSGEVAIFNRQGSDGDISVFRKDGSTVGSIGTLGGDFYITTAGASGLFLGGTKLQPMYNGSLSDNTIDLGHPDRRFDDIYATNGTINTSDFNEKQDIASLTATEMLVGKRISALFKTFRWKDSVAEKGDNARTHTGVIAQDVQAAFTAEGLDAGDYALFISSTWWEHDVEVPAVEAVDEVTDEDGNVTTEAVEAKDAYTRTDTYDTEAEAPEGATERTRLGIRYPELLSFVAAYNEQRFASIEARLTALEDV
jgi:hypothetical protein